LSHGTIKNSCGKVAEIREKRQPAQKRARNWKPDEGGLRPNFALTLHSERRGKKKLRKGAYMKRKIVDLLSSSLDFSPLARHSRKKLIRPGGNRGRGKETGMEREKKGTPATAHGKTAPSRSERLEAAKKTWPPRTEAPGLVEKVRQGRQCRGKREVKLAAVQKGSGILDSRSHGKEKTTRW